MHTGEEKQPFYYEHGLRMAEELEALPLTHAFEQVMKDHLLSEKILYHAERPIIVESDIVSTTLKDTFFFPESSSITDLTVDVSSYKDQTWVLQSNFSVGGKEYRILASHAGCSIIDTDGYGVAKPQSITLRSVNRLLAALLSTEIQNIPGEFTKKINDYDAEKDVEVMKNLLRILGNVNGRIITTRTSEFPCDQGDRSIISTVTETESPRLSGISTNLEINWQLFENHPNTEIEVNLREVKVGETKHVRFGRRGSTLVSVEDHVLSKQLPELFTLESQQSESKEVSPEDADWLNLATTFMATVGPLMSPYKHLDS